LTLLILHEVFDLAANDFQSTILTSLQFPVAPCLWCTEGADCLPDCSTYIGPMSQRAKVKREVMTIGRSDDNREE
jgi:hypothetical protein